MNNNGDAAEQVVRLSLEGMEVTAKLTGTAAKHLAVLFLSVLNQEQKTRGKARLTSMIRSGKELKVFAIPQKDLDTFVKHAKQYGVLYCVLKDKDNSSPNAVVDVIARAEDAAKIQRIFDRFGIGKVEQTSVLSKTREDTTPPFTKPTDKNAPSNKSSMSEDTPDKPKTSVREKLQAAKEQKKAAGIRTKEVIHREAAQR